jgi:carboxymethylenebutenolidase
MRTMAKTTIEIQTEDGKCPAYVFQPPGAGPWPGVLFYMDGIGMRAALHELGERLATAGYYVLMPDLFYRSGPYTAASAKELFANPQVRKEWFEKFSVHATVANIMRDTKAFVAHLATHPGVRRGKLGCTGYCMGGRMAITAAGQFPEAFGAVASYHPGNLATDAPDSPHLLAPKIKARIYVGGAMDDANFPDEQKRKLEQALVAAHVDHVIETYAARHGWVPSDTPTHDPAEAENHWKSLLDLFDQTLR